MNASYSSFPDWKVGGIFCIAFALLWFNETFKKLNEICHGVLQQVVFVPVLGCVFINDLDQNQEYADEMHFYTKLGGI